MTTDPQTATTSGSQPIIAGTAEATPLITFPGSVDMAVAIVARTGAQLKPLPKPWGDNHATTTILSDWYRRLWPNPLDAVTTDIVEAALLDKLWIPAKGPYRMVINFEDTQDPWANWQYDEMSRYAAALKEKFPHLILSAYLYQPRLLLQERTQQDQRDHTEFLRDFGNHPFWDEMSPSMYVRPTDLVSSQIGQTVQGKVMSICSMNLFPTKRLSPFVWFWLGGGHPYSPMTSDQFWMQVRAGIASPKTRAIVAWGDLNGPAEQARFDLQPRKLFAPPKVATRSRVPPVA